MRTTLKGVNRVRTRLASGEIVTYYYAWKGGPRLSGKPGSAEFHAAYVEATKKPEVSTGKLGVILEQFQKSGEFRNNIAARTQSDYRAKLRLIDKKFGDYPLKGLSDRRTRGLFLEWRDELAIRSRRQADYTWVVLSRVLSWALGRGLIDVNPCEKAGRLYRGSRVDKVWTVDDEALFIANGGSRDLSDALLAALWTGLRQGDLLKMTWANYDGRHIRVNTSKGRGKVRVMIPVGSPLKLMLDNRAAHRSTKTTVILTSSRGDPWTEDGFRSSWAKACARAGIIGLTFNDLRGTAVTRLALAGCTEAEIATITGHSLRDVRSILDAHYLHRDPALAESAIRKLENMIVQLPREEVP
jgi:integrase